MQSTSTRRSHFDRFRILTAAAVVIAAGTAIESVSAASPNKNLKVDPLAAPVAAAAAVRVLSEIPYNSYVALTCNVSVCFGRLPPVKVKERLLMQFISCVADTAKDAILRQFSVQVTDAKVTKSRVLHFLAPTYQSDRVMQTVIYGISQTIALTVEPDSIVHLGAGSIGNIGNVQCSVSGVKQTLA